MRKKILLVIFLFTFLSGCSVYKSLTNISKLKFKLDSVGNFKISNISVNRKSSLKDFNALDLLKLTSEVAKGDLPVAFTLNVDAFNPNSVSTANQSSDITLESFPWKLFIDNRQTISGNISKPVVVPGKGGHSIIPLSISMNLMEFFKNESLNGILNLALNLGGEKGSASHIKIVADPVLGTPIGNIKYPNSLTIVDKEFH